VRLLVTTPRYGLPRLVARTTIGSGFPERTDPAALVIGPTGVGLGQHGTLYVADTLNNRIAAIPDAMFRRGSAGTGRTLTENGAVNGPLGLAIAPGGDILTVNSGDGNLVVTTPSGKQVAVRTLDTSGSPAGAGALFGLAVAPHARGVYFVDDNTNTLDLLS
jgi:DNA-binding beta-propeller fold protein YncE